MPSLRSKLAAADNVPLAEDDEAASDDEAPLAVAEESKEEEDEVPLAEDEAVVPAADDGAAEDAKEDAADDAMDEDAPPNDPAAIDDLPPDEFAAALSKAKGVVKEMTMCSCSKSQCLQLYCECLSKGKFCGDHCACDDCYNTTEHDQEGGIRLESIRYILSRKPDALTEEMRAHAHEGGWEPPAKTPKKAPKAPRKADRKIPVRSAAAKTVAKAKHARAKSGTKAKGGTKAKAVAAPKLLEEDESSEEEQVTVIPFSTDEFPQLTLDESSDYTDLATAFKKPLFDDPSRPLEIAYSQRLAASNERKRAQKKKNDILVEYKKVKAKFQEKKLELSLANEEVKGHSQKVGVWTRKVFDLELDEPCQWNTNLKKLREYKDEHGKLPPSSKKAIDEDQKPLCAWLDRIRGQRNMEEREDDSEDTPKEKFEKKHNKNKKFIRDYPHRLESLAKLGVVWESRPVNKWETMFGKLLEYQQEQGTLRFPTDEQCAATGDEGLISLQKWVKGQVLNNRYGKNRNPAQIKRLVDIGFDFEKWYAKPGKARRSKGEKVESVDVDDRKMPAKEESNDVEMKVGESEVV